MIAKFGISILWRLWWRGRRRSSWECRLVEVRASALDLTVVSSAELVSGSRGVALRVCVSFGSVYRSGRFRPRFGLPGDRSTDLYEVCAPGAV